MALFFPRDPIVASDVLELDAINSAIQDVQSEVSGELNEHNFSAFALEDAVEPPVPDPPSHVVMDFAIAAHHTINEDDPYGGPFRGMVKSTSWHPVFGAELEFDTAGGNVHIVASWQAHHSAASNFSPGMMYAFEVDGNVLPDALIGSGDMGNDLISNGIDFNPFDGDGFGAWATGPGVIAEDIGLCLELLTYMAPGRHVVRLMSRYVSVDNESGGLAFTTNLDMYALDLRDL